VNQLALAAPMAAVGARLKRVPPRVQVGLVMIGCLVVLSVLVPLLSPYDPQRGTGSDPLMAPSGQHLLGTDHLGRDVLVRAFVAAQMDLLLATVGVSLPLVVGTLVGSMIGSTRSRVVQYVGEVAIEGINAFPTLIVVIALIAAFGPGVNGILVALFMTAWARYAKVARGRALTIRDLGYLQVARGLGYGWPRILAIHVAPNVFPTTISYAVSDFVVVILAIAGLSFLGAGVQPPMPEWGAMMSEGRLYLARAWWIALGPGVLLSFTAVAVSLIASGSSEDAFTQSPR
jgi:peptide/nickel transport system permease protein